uniref:Tetratricopeptide repeat protein n=1 Tax=Corethron hystrix TaxID=216773 RepID=A0A7S1G3Q1_9STRA|mmetsp:Transcript_9355/g.20727  ORF Transcript_9355/g.20727 Transcript_9355/m.20727 type:complete len:228 (+) Transcript_9355:565-1248(+)
MSMASDGKRPDGRAAYFEFADAYVQRGLAHEGLAGRPEQRPVTISAEAEWQRAVADYDEALLLWGPGGGGSGGIGPNPFVLTYRGNARAALGEYDGALADFRLAESLFTDVAKKDATAGYRRLDALANEALALYALGRTEEAARLARTVVAKRPGVTDMRALIAADQWDRGERELADAQWFEACSDIASGCKKYTDAEWLRTVRRWPPSLVEAQMRFIKRVSPPPRG